jgi:MFS transporter, MFS domain-containing protein family, molybdate-anion transporter
MDIFYTATFGILSLFTAVTLFYEQKQQKTGAAQTAQNVLFARFRNNYLTVFSLMMGRLSSGISVAPSMLTPVGCAAGDWLQGPYVYRLYEYYGFGVGQIGHLFIAGFGSSFVFGTVVGSLADK